MSLFCCRQTEAKSAHKKTTLVRVEFVFNNLVQRKTSAPRSRRGKGKSYPEPTWAREYKHQNSRCSYPLRRRFTVSRKLDNGETSFHCQGTFHSRVKTV